MTIAADVKGLPAASIPIRIILLRYVAPPLKVKIPFRIVAPELVVARLWIKLRSIVLIAVELDELNQ